MKLLFISLMYLLTSTHAGFTNAQEVDGTWSTVMNSQEGRIEVVYQFETNEGELSGSVFTSDGVFLITQGTVKGSTVWFTIDYGNITVYHTGYLLREQLLISTTYQGSTGQITLNRVD